MMVGSTPAFCRAVLPHRAAKGVYPFPAAPLRTTGGQTRDRRAGGASSAKDRSGRRHKPRRGRDGTDAKAPSAPAVCRRCRIRRGGCNGRPNGWRRKCLHRNGGSSRNLLVAAGICPYGANGGAAFGGCSADCEVAIHSSFFLVECPDGLFLVCSWL